MLRSWGECDSHAQTLRAIALNQKSVNYPHHPEIYRTPSEPKGWLIFFRKTINLKFWDDFKTVGAVRHRAPIHLYLDKLRDYEVMGIPEYWICDYAALGGRVFIGSPKTPTIFVCQLIDGEYQMTPFRGGDRIVSPTFPQLNLTAQQIFDSVK